MTTAENPTWDTIEDVADAVRTCTKCRLHSCRTNAVPGDGSAVASILIVGEGPGFNEDQFGLPFVGRSGKLLGELLATVPLSREDVFITNVVKCRPPNNRDPLPDEVAACRPYLEFQMQLINPKVIVTLGRHSLLRFYPEGKISNDHGKILQWGDRILLPLYHPAAGLRNPAIKRDLQRDVLMLPEALRESLRRTNTVSLIPNAGELQIQQANRTSKLSETSTVNRTLSDDVVDQISEPIIGKDIFENEQGENQLGMF